MGARSKGCRTCKARRLKCDEQEPTCRRCQKANLICPGYDSIFVDETVRVKQNAQKSELMVVASRKQRYHSHKTQYSHTSQNVGDPNATIPLVAFKDKIAVAFLTTRMFEARSRYRADSLDNEDLTQSMVMCSDRWWVCKLIQSPQESLDALALMYFSRVHHLKDVEADASKQYGQALQKLRVGLTAPNNLYDFQTLGNISALIFYEVMTLFTAYLALTNLISFLLSIREMGGSLMLTVSLN
jgi:hypothetical protein